MIGAIIGDIVGSRFEFNNIKTKKFHLFDKKCSITDDSVMSVAVAEMCLNNYVPKNKEMIIQTFKKWGKKYPNVGYGSRFFDWLLSDDSTPYNSCGNGSAMRISAIGFYANSKEEVELYSRSVTEVTHNHPEGIKGAYVVAMCIYLARKGASKKEIKEFVEKYYNIDFDYEKLRRTYKHEEEICQNTVPQAIYCFLISKGFEDCLRTTISIGGDCDTTAAISCAIAEAYYGIPTSIIEEASEFIPSDMKEIIDKFDFKTKSSSRTRYGNILKFIKPLEEYPEKLGRHECFCLRKDENGQTFLTGGYSTYESETIEFLKAMESFMVYNYVKVIESYGIKYENIDIHKLELEKYDDKLILALLTAIIRSDRFNDGLIISKIKDGSFLKLLLRLKDFDEPLLKKDIITKIDYSFRCFGSSSKNEHIIIDITHKDEARIEYSSFGMYKPINLVTLNEFDSYELITKLNRLNILKWKDNYEPDERILDGASWSMEIDTYNLGHIHKYGSNAFPSNWHSFRAFRNWIIRKIREYQEEDFYCYTSK